jgi:hypothetical protein
MLAKDIQVGHVYVIRHHDGQLYAVRVEYLKTRNTYGGRNGVVRTMTHYVCTKLVTGRIIEVKSAAKFRHEVV